MSITNSISCEMCSVIQFLNVKIIQLTEIHYQVVEMYGESVKNKGIMHKSHLLNGGRKDVHNEG
jgi:hypothetical protein